MVSRGGSPERARENLKIGNTGRIKNCVKGQNEQARDQTREGESQRGRRRWWIVGELCYSEVFSNEDIVSNLSHMTTTIEASKR